MTLEQSGRTSYRWLTITLLVGGGVYAWYAISQYGRLNELNQRQLSNAAAELKVTADRAVETVRQFDRKWKDWKKPAGTAGPRPAQEEPRVCDFDRDQPYLELEDCDTVRWAAFSAIEPTLAPTLGIEARESDPKAERVAFRFRTDTLLQDLAFPDSFSLIFVATDDGTILFQDAPVRRRWLRRLRWGEQTFRDASAERPPTFQVQNLQEVLGGAETWKQLRSVSSQTRIRLGGSLHQLYLHPLVFENGKRTELIVGGAVPTTLLIRDALALNTYLLGVLVFLLLLGVLGFPFVKLASLDPRERFRLRDIQLLYLSTSALLVLVTCASLALDGYVRWHAAADEGLEALARDVERRFRSEVKDIRDQVMAYDAEVSGASIPSCEQWPVRTNWFQDPELPGPAVASGLRLPWPARSIHLSQVAWIRSDGQQIWKSTAGAIQGTTPVDQRVYFRAARDGNLFEIPGEEPAFFFGPDRSIADGKFYTFLSMRSRIPSTFCRETQDVGSTPVVAATAQLLSLDRQPLPAGYGFAVVNREGRVLYHSDSRLSLRENFFEELSDGNRARALIYAGRSDTLKSRYREAAHEFYFQPVGIDRAGEREFAGLYVSAFRDTSVERAVVGHAFVAGLAGPMVLLLGVYGLGLWGIALASRYTDQSSSAWLWPHGGLEHIYRRQSLAFLALLVGSVAFYLIIQSIAAFVLMPILAAAVGIAIYMHGKRRAGPRRRLSAGSWQTAALLLVLACMIVGPSAALFRLTLSHEFAKMIVTERAWIVSQQRDAVRAAEIEALADGYGRSRGVARESARRTHFSCVPGPFDADDRQAEAHGPRSLEADVRRAQHTAPAGAPVTPVPADSLAACPGERGERLRESKRSAMLQPIGLDARLIDALHWPSDALPIENPIFLRQHFQDREDREYALSPAGTLITWLRISGTGAASFALMLGLLIWWIRWNTNRLFLADLENDETAAPPSAPFDEMWKACEQEEQMVLLQVARDRLANPYQRRRIQHLITRGLLRLNPDVRPSTEEFDRFLRDKECHARAQMSAWQEVNVGHSWRYVRLILAVSVTGLGFFLVATQPGLQSSLIGIATGITGALTTGLKLRDAVASWFADRKSAT